MSANTNVSQLQSRTDQSARISESEWALRVDLAACYRLCAHYGWTDLVFTHISARVPGTQDHFLLKPQDFMFEEVTAGSLVKVDVDGNKVADSPYEVQRAAFVIHSAVHAARPQVACVIHTHSKAGMAFSTIKNCELLPITQHAQMFYNNVAYHDYESFAENLDERARLARDLGDKWVMILRNHGLLVCGETVGRAFSFLSHLEKALEAQLYAMSTGAEINIPSKEVSEITSQRVFSDASPIGRNDWPALLRLLDRKDASFRN
jgi:ribulose-5-phosphate 4-epimerase/fuculose-1-phosphate aldolase